MPINNPLDITILYAAQASQALVGGSAHTAVERRKLTQFLPGHAKAKFLGGNCSENLYKVGVADPL